MKLVFEIAVAHQTKARNQTFDWVVDPNCPPVPTVQPRPYLVKFWLNYAKSPKHAKIEQKMANFMTQKPYAHIWAYASNLKGIGHKFAKYQYF